MPPAIPRVVREAYLQTFAALGGAEGLRRWALASREIARQYPNLTKFYEMVAGKLIPAEAHTTHEHTGTVYQVTVEQRNVLPGRPQPQRRLAVIGAELIPAQPPAQIAAPAPSPSVASPADDLTF